MMLEKLAQPADASDAVAETRRIVRLANELLDVDDICDSVPDNDLHAADAALSAVNAALSMRLDLMAQTSTSATSTQISALLLCVEQTHLPIKDAILVGRSQGVRAAHLAVHGLRGVRSLAALAERVPVEAYQIGFTRVLFSRIESGVWFTSSAFAGEDRQLANIMVAAGLSNPRRLTNALPEWQMLRRRVPILVQDAVDDPRVYPELNEVTKSCGYVAAPVYSWGQPIGLIHADRHTGVCGVHEFDCELLGIFAEGLGIAFERNSLLERLQSMRQAAGEYLRTANALADDFTIDVMGQAGPGPEFTERLIAEQPAAPLAGHGSGANIVGDLTPRECEVMRALAAGRTNAQIAASLFVTDGTVKSHVKRILRKMGAGNRTEAVAKFHQARANSHSSAVAAL